jgi:hypothetical protein
MLKEISTKVSRIKKEYLNSLDYHLTNKRFPHRTHHGSTVSTSALTHSLVLGASSHEVRSNYPLRHIPRYSIAGQCLLVFAFCFSDDD